MKNFRELRALVITALCLPLSWFVAYGPLSEFMPVNYAFPIMVLMAAGVGYASFLNAQTYEHFIHNAQQHISFDAFTISLYIVIGAWLLSDNSIGLGIGFILFAVAIGMFRISPFIGKVPESEEVFEVGQQPKMKHQKIEPTYEPELPTGHRIARVEHLKDGRDVQFIVDQDKHEYQRWIKRS